jgi:hypothetical protein
MLPTEGKKNCEILSILFLIKSTLQRNYANQNEGKCPVLVPPAILSHLREEN